MSLPLIVPVARVAAALGLRVEKLDVVQTALIADQIRDSEAKVATALNRDSLHATAVTISGMTPNPWFAHDDVKAWPEWEANDRYRVKSATPTATPTDLHDDRWDVTFLVGLDVAGDPALDPIRRFIRLDAVDALNGHPLLPEAARRIESVSAGGQSATYSKPSAVATESGGKPTLDSLRRWKRQSITRSRVVAAPVFPYYDTPRSV